MKRLFILISVCLFFASFALNGVHAQRQRNIHQAIIDGDVEHIKSRISSGEDVNQKNSLGRPLLHTAIRHSKTEIIQLLIENGADINAKDNGGRTPLHFASETGQKVIVEKLIAKGAEINVIDNQADNALSLANKNKQIEIADLLKKHGAEEPDPEALTDERYYYEYGREPGAGPNTNPAGRTQPGITAGNVFQSNVIVNLLADPNEIKTRVKKFVGLEKAIKEVSDKSTNEERQWLQTRRDNRTTLARYVNKQFEDEIDFIRKIAVEESAKKTVEAIDSLRTNRRKRSLKINRELLVQKREQKQAESANTRGRGRTTGRGTRGRTSIRGQTSGTNTTDSQYGSGAVNFQRGQGFENENRSAEQLDPQTQEQMRLWLQATPDKKVELARAIHPQIQAEIGSIRTIAVEEKAKKTTAAIDGLLLARQDRFDKLVLKMEEDQRKLQEKLQKAQSQYNRNTDSLQQQNTRRTRRR